VPFARAPCPRVERVAQLPRLYRTPGRAACARAQRRQHLRRQRSAQLGGGGASPAQPDLRRALKPGLARRLVCGQPPPPTSHHPSRSGFFTLNSLRLLFNKLAVARWAGAQHRSVQGSEHARTLLRRGRKKMKPELQLQAAAAAAAGVPVVAAAAGVIPVEAVESPRGPAVVQGRGGQQNGVREVVCQPEPERRGPLELGVHLLVGGKLLRELEEPLAPLGELAQAPQLFVPDLVPLLQHAQRPLAVPQKQSARVHPARTLARLFFAVVFAAELEAH